LTTFVETKVGLAAQQGAARGHPPD
jgi:hypothetical protein